MSKRGNWIGDASFAGGEQSDLPPHLIPQDGLLKADNVVLSKTGRLSKRGPVQPYLITPKDDTIWQLAQYTGTAYSPSSRGFALGGTTAGYSPAGQRWYTWTLVNPPTSVRGGYLSTGQLFQGANSNQNTDFAFAKPTTRTPPAFNYLGLPFFPSGSSSDGFYAFAGKPDWTGQPNLTPVAAAVTVTANNPTITIPNTILPTANAGTLYPGNFIYIYLPNATAASRRLYIGIITFAQAAGANTSLQVYPTPQNSFSGNCWVGVTPYASGPLFSRKGTTSQLSLNNAYPPTTEPVIIQQNIFAATSHQNRIVCAGTQLQEIPSVAASVLPDPSKTQNAVITWSAIAGEPSTASSTNADGILPLQLAGWPASQRITLETAGIVALVSMDANNLMVLCEDKTIMISGVLGTILPAGGVNTSSFNIRTISQRVGCIDALSVQRTPLGVMFASRDGVYITDGASFTNVMEGKIQIKWNKYVDEILGLDVPITGSALVGDTHYCLFTGGGLSPFVKTTDKFICDLYNNFSWTTMTVGAAYDGGNLSYGYGIQDYRGRSEVYAPKVTSLYDVSTTCDRIVLLDSILETEEKIVTSVPGDGASVKGQFAQSIDAGTFTAVNAEFWTRAYTFGDPSTLKAYKTMTATYLADAKVNGTDPVSTYVAEGLEPTTSTGTPYSTVGPSPSGDTAPLRVSLVPRVIDNGVSFGFKTNYVRADSPAVGIFSSPCRFSLYELALNFVGLRRGRTKQ